MVKSAAVDWARKGLDISVFGHSLREFAKRASQGVTLTRTLPARFGGHSIVVTPESALKYWILNPEQAKPELFRWVDEFVRPGMNIWDVGANVGLFSFASLASTGNAGQVVAIEGDTWLASLLERTCEKWPKALQECLTVLPVIASDVDGLISFDIVSDDRARNSIAGVADSKKRKATSRTVTAPSMPLDSLLENFEAPDVIKIDVEGAEDRVLQGATSVLRECRPTVIVEVAPENSDEIGELFESFSYAMYDAHANEGERVEIREPAYDTLAVPRPV